MALAKAQNGSGASGGQFTKAQLSWLAWFCVVSYAMHFSKVMIDTVFGPTQPYIARNVGTDMVGISSQWSVGNAAWLLGSIISSAIFKKYISTPKMKVT